MLHEVRNSFRLLNHYHIECFRDGRLIWEERKKNLTVNVGLNEILDKFWKGSSYTAGHFVGLLSATPTIVAGNTMASHAGWTEVQDYDESTRRTLTLGSVSAQSVDNSASKATFTMNATVSVGGAFIVTNNTKGGTSGILMGAVAFGANRDVFDDDVINVTAALTAASA